jgi:hypothetical protein
LKSVATVSGASPAACRIVGKAPGAGAMHQRAPKPMRAATQRLHDLAEAGRVFLRAPGPVAMQVDVVVSEPLLERQAGAEPLVGRLGDTRLSEAQRGQQFTQPPYLVVVGGRRVSQSTARGGAGGVRCGGTDGDCLRRQVLGQQSQPPAPVGQRLARIGEQPRDLANDREAAAAAPADPPRTSERNRATATARAGEHTGKRVLICGGHRNPVRVDPRGNAGGDAARGQRVDLWSIPRT